MGERSRISWWAVVEGQRIPRSDSMRGNSWDASCSCGWDSRTGGAVMSSVRKTVNEHKLLDHGIGSKPRTRRPEPAQAAAAEAEAASRRARDEAVDAAKLELAQALQLVAEIDRLPAPESTRRIGDPDAQRALEIVGRAKARSGWVTE